MEAKLSLGLGDQDVETIWLLDKFGGPVYGCACKKSPVIWGPY